MINRDVRKAVETELRAGETLLWADKPAKMPLSFMALYMSGFSLVWTTMAVSFVGVGAVTAFMGEGSSETADTAAFGIAFFAISLLFVFVVIGVCMFLWGLKLLIGPSKELYAITNQRGIVISPFLKYRVANLSPEILRNSERKGRPDLGTLTFMGKGNGFMGMWMNPYQTELNAFQKIQNPKQVEDLIYKTFGLAGRK